MRSRRSSALTRAVSRLSEVIGAPEILRVFFGTRGRSFDVSPVCASGFATAEADQRSPRYFPDDVAWHPGYAWAVTTRSYDLSSPARRRQLGCALAAWFAAVILLTAGPAALGVSAPAHAQAAPEANPQANADDQTAPAAAKPAARPAPTQTTPAAPKLGAALPPGAIKAWQLTGGGVRVTLDAAVLAAMLSDEVPGMADQVPSWLRRGVVWGRTRYVDPQPVVDDVALEDIGRTDQVRVIVNAGVMAERERGHWRWRGLRSGVVWTRQGPARIADMTAYGRILLALGADRTLVVTAVVDTVTGTPRLRFLDRVRFTLGLGGREVHQQRIELPELGFGFAVNQVSIVGVERGDVVLDLDVGPMTRPRE